MFTNPTLTEIGAKYGKTAAQTALRFLLQSDVVVIPKSDHKDRMQQNFSLIMILKLWSGLYLSFKERCFK